MRLTFEKGKGGESIKWKADLIEKNIQYQLIFQRKGSETCQAFLQSQNSIFLIYIRHALLCAYNGEKKFVFIAVACLKNSNMKF